MEATTSPGCLLVRPFGSRLSAASVFVVGCSGSAGVRRRVAVVVPLDAAPSSGITRPLVEILRDLNKRVPDTVVRSSRRASPSDPVIPWYHANRMLSFYAPGMHISSAPT